MIKMREIIFRGKAYYNGEWYYGSLIRDHSSRTAGICIYVELPKNENFFGHLSNCNIYRVDPETVGQFTGLTDKNGQRIFEGDIVSHKGQIYEIKYSTKQARFLALLSNGVFNPVVMQNCEVIGNVHDNPEMLEHPQQ